MISARRLTSVASALAIATTLAACTAAERLAQVGEAPPLTQVQNPTAAPNYRPVSMPMPNPRPVTHESNSLWRSGSRAFFKDQRAVDVGDIVTVVIDIEDQAKMNNTTTRSRANTENASASTFLGYEQSLYRWLPNEINNNNLVDLDSQTANSGAGTINRTEDIQMKVAAVITQVLPNGNLVLHGRQEVRVNYEMREMQIAGVIRREDISSANTVGFEKIAEARIAYGGRGHISDVQQPRIGQQVYDIVFPF